MLFAPRWWNGSSGYLKIIVIPGRRWSGGMVYTHDSKSCAQKACGFESHLQHSYMKKLVIGLVGEKGSGKQTFVNFLKEIRGDLNIRQVRFSDILTQTLLLWDIPITRANLQKLSLLMKDEFGADSLAKAAKFLAEDDSSNLIIFDGIRRKTERDLVKKMKNNLIIYITANRDLRYNRLKKRSEKVGEVGLTHEQFMKEEKSKAEADIPNLGKKADLKLENNGTKEEFKSKIRQLQESL